MKKLNILLVLLSFLMLSCSGKVDESEVKKAQQFFESVFQDRVLDSPEFQASLGYKSNYDQWDDITWQKSRAIAGDIKPLRFPSVSSNSILIFHKLHSNAKPCQLPPICDAHDVP